MSGVGCFGLPAAFFADAGDEIHFVVVDVTGELELVVDDVFGGGGGDGLALGF